jgi:large subunit ribosomal protein L10e
MAGLRKFKCYRTVKRAYTRKSKFKRKSYIKTVPVSKIVRYSMGTATNDYKYEVNLSTTERIQVRDNAIESARIVSNRQLENKLGKTEYYFRIRTYPHHILRENKMLVGAGADRMQTGMQQSFGRVVGIAVQLKKDQKIFSVYVNKSGLEAARDSLKAAIRRLPFHGSVKVNEIRS